MRLEVLDQQTSASHSAIEWCRLHPDQNFGGLGGGSHRKGLDCRRKWGQLDASIGTPYRGKEAGWNIDGRYRSINKGDQSITKVIGVWLSILTFNTSWSVSLAHGTKSSHLIQCTVTSDCL